MKEDITTQLCKAISPEVYTKSVCNFHLKCDEIANRYDEMISHFKCDNCVEVDRESTEAALSIGRGTSELQCNNEDVPKGRAHIVLLDPINYDQYDSRANSPDQVADNNRSQNYDRKWNQRGNNMTNDQNPQGNRRKKLQ